MNYKTGLSDMWNECLAEILKDEVLSEDDQLDLDIAKEGFLAQISKEAVSEEDARFIEENLPIYKRLFMGLLTDDKKEMKIATLELLRAKNQSI